MRQFFITMAGVFAGLVLFVVGVPFLLVVMAAGAARPDATPAQSVLRLDLRDPLSDQDPQNPLAGLGRRSQSVMGIVETLRRASADSHIRGLLIRLPEGGMEPGAADEIRLAIHRFKATGKPVIAHSQGLYASGVTTATYMVGAAANQLWMQPASAFQATGIATEDIFFKRAFDRYGVTAAYQQRQEYKNAVNAYLYSDYTPAHRQAQLSWMGSVYASNLALAAKDRKVPPEALRSIIEAGPYMAETARARGLIDRVGQVREAELEILRLARARHIVDTSDYGGAREDDEGSGPAIAVVEAEGAIVTGRDGVGNPFTGSSMIYSDNLSKALYDAVKDDDVRAIVLRVNSPGGSDTASEQILAAVRAAKAARKPVVVSMGTYAASGGYWISSEASSIVAQPTTLTGSIGVYGGKFAIGEALARFGLDIRSLSVGGDYAGSMGSGQDFSESERKAFSNWMDQIYANFVARVAEGRKLPEARVREIARGRVWTGSQALEIGLVDRLGGFYDAVDQARTLAGLKGEVRLKRMAPQATPLEALEQILGVSAMSARTLAAAAWVLGDPRAETVLNEIGEARLRQEGARVMAPTPLH